MAMLVMVSVIRRFYRSGLLAHQPTPKLEGQGITLHLVSTLQPVWHGWPYQEYNTPADIALGVLETYKLSHHGKVVIPSGAFIKLSPFPIYDEHETCLTKFLKLY